MSDKDALQTDVIVKKGNSLKSCLIPIIRSSSNPMDKGACNSIHYQYYGQNSNMASSVTMYITGYIILTHSRDTLNGLLLHRLV